MQGLNLRPSPFFFSIQSIYQTVGGHTTTVLMGHFTGVFHLKSEKTKPWGWYEHPFLVYTTNVLTLNYRGKRCTSSCKVAARPARRL